MSNSLDNVSDSESDSSLTSDSESSVTSSVLQPINTISGNSNSCNFVILLQNVHQVHI